MKIFISWSGIRSRGVAEALRAWLGDVFQDIETWMSANDLEAGANWGTTLAAQLESTSFGIICLTPENITAPWLLFEAGALSKLTNAARVIPYRLGLKPTDVGYPIAQFQSVDADKAGTLKLLKSVNEGRSNPLSDERLNRIFLKWWPDLSAEINAIKPLESEPTPNTRTERALLEEILETVRSQAQRNSSRIDDHAGFANPDFGNLAGNNAVANAANVANLAAIARTANAPNIALEPPKSWLDDPSAIGTQVRHGQFGFGTVVAVEGSGPFAKVTADFHAIGRKRVVAHFLARG